MKRLLLLLASAASALLAQPTQNTTIQPDCLIPFTLTAAGNFPAATANNGPGDNRQKGCAAWTLMYQSTGFTGVSVTLQSGSSVSTTVTFGSFAGTISMGYVNPIVSDTGGSLQAANGTADISWVRVNLTASGSGTVSGVLYGFRNSSAAVSGGGGGDCPESAYPQVQYYASAKVCGGNAAFISNFTALAVPSAPVITHAGTAGMATWGYEIVAGMIGGSPVALGSAASAEGTTATGNATLTGGNYNIITPPVCATGVTSYDIYRTTAATSPTSTGLIGNVSCGGNLHDTGLAAVAPFTGPPSTDYSVGVGTSIPFVNTSSGSCFGSWCLANNDVFSPFSDSSTGLGVFEHTGNPSFDYSSFTSDLVIDTNTGGVNAIKASLELEINAGGGIAYAASVRDRGFTSSSVAGASISFDMTGIAGGVTGAFVGGGVNQATTVWGYYQDITASGPVTDFYGYFTYSPAVTGGGSITNGYEYYGKDMGTGGAGAGMITNPYYSWFDSRGVRRVKEDATFNSVGQAIEALYNPQFTKYTPGATDYERIIDGQWSSNVAQMGTEAGGTGTLRQIQEIGNGWIAVSYAFASLGALTNGTYKYCSDCTVTSGIDDTCAGSGSGAFAVRINGAWKCSL